MPENTVKMETLKSWSLPFLLLLLLFVVVMATRNIFGAF